MGYKRKNNWTEEQRQKQSEICHRAYMALPEEKKEMIKQSGRGINIGNQFNRQWTDEMLAELKRLYWAERLSWRNIAEKLDKPYRAIRYAFEYWNIPRRGHSEAAIYYHERNGTDSISGENNPNWRGGTSCEPYTAEFSEIREQIRKRDNYTCQLCGVPEVECFRALDIHHIDYDKKNDNDINLISLCCSCHSPTQTNRLYWTKHFTDLLRRRNIL